MYAKSKCFRSEVKNLEKKLNLISQGECKECKECKECSICKECREMNAIKEMLGRHIFWYRRHAEINKTMFRAGSFFIILINAAMIVVSFLIGNLTLTILSALTMLIRTAMDLYCALDNWKRYRSTLEKLLAETDLFIIKAGVYDISTNDARNKLFVIRIAEITGTEIKDWEKLRDSEKDELPCTKPKKA